MVSSVKVASGLGFLLIAPPSAYATYHVLSSGNTSSSSWLKEKGYAFSQPQFTSHSKISRGCSENLFKEMDGLDNNKLYGCALMKMERTSDKKFIKFNSEVALRKGDEGWIINTVLENYKKVTPYSPPKSYLDDRLVFKYLFTKKNLTNEPKEEKWFFNSIGADPNTPTIYIKTPKREKQVWNNGEELERKDLAKEEDTISFSEKEEFSGIWISGNNKSESWVFENIEMWGSEKKYSEVFCNHGTTNGDCEDIGWNAGTKQAYKINTKVDTWEQGNNSANSSGSAVDIVDTQIIPMINAIKGIRGEWVNLSSICGLKDEKNPNQDQQINLRLYCTK